MLNLPKHVLGDCLRSYKTCGVGKLVLKSPVEQKIQDIVLYRPNPCFQEIISIIFLLLKLNLVELIPFFIFFSSLVCYQSHGIIFIALFANDPIRPRQLNILISVLLCLYMFVNLGHY